MTDNRWNKKTRKRITIQCPKCEQSGTLRKRQYDENTDYYICKNCSNEWWEGEIIKKEYALGVFHDEQTGETAFMHYNEGWRERTVMRKALRKRDINLLRKIRGEK